MPDPRKQIREALQGAGGPDEERKAEDIAEAFRLLLKGIKNIAIYRHAEARFPEYLDPAYKKLTEFLATEAVLPLRLGPYTLEYKKQVIYEEEHKENLTYKFYKDGMRFLMFREGLPMDELLAFILIAIEERSASAMFNEDYITRLWKHNFQHIEYVVVEGFEFGEMGQEEVQIEVDKIVAYLRKQLQANSKDVTRFARMDIADLDLELSDIDQVRGGIISGRPAKERDKEWVQTELLIEDKKRLFAKMVLVLFQLLERDSKPDDEEMLSEMFSQVLDSLIISEDVRGCVAVLHRFDQISNDQRTNKQTKSLVANIRTAFVRRMQEPERLRTVGSYLTLAKTLDEMAVKAYFSVCGDDSLLLLVEMLEGMERQEGRLILIDVLAVLGKEHVSVFANRLDHKSSNVVRDMLSIIDKIDPPDKLDLYGRCLDHPNLMIRIEGLKVIARSADPRANDYLEKAMGDDDLQIRLQAYRALAVNNPQQAVPVLRKRMRDGDYTALDRREQIAIATSLGETRTKDALRFFSTVLDERAPLFGRQKSNEVKSMAIAGLCAMKNIDAFNVLAKQVQNKKNTKETIEAAHKAAIQLKSELTGEPLPRR